MIDVESEIRAFIAKSLATVEDPDEIEVDTSLTRTGLLDSVAVVELVVFLETTYRIQIADADTTPENFDTIGALGRYVRRKLAVPESPQA